MARGSEGSELVEAVEAIYRAASEPDHWPEALQAITGCFGDVGANLLYQRENGDLGMVVSPGLEAAHRDYESGWWRSDIRLIRAIERGYAAGNDVCSDHDLVTDAEMESHPFYTQYLASHGLRWALSASISPDPKVAAGLILQRAATKPPFDEQDLALFGRLARHAENALRLSIRLMQAEVAQAAFGSALARLDAGVFLIDSVGRAIPANPVAEGLLESVLWLDGGRLGVLRSRHQGAPLEEAIRETAAWNEADELPRPQPVVLGSRNGDKFHVAYVLPVPARASAAFSSLFADVRALVLVLSSSPDDVLDASLVRDLLDLTLAEARVASLVGAGLGPQEAARRLGITEGTVRTTLKRVFSKTSVSRQSELSALLARLGVR